MKRFITAVSIMILCGCVDVGRVGLHPDIKTAYYKGHVYQIESCLISTAMAQNLTLEEDAPLSGGTKRFNLVQSGNTVIAWIEIYRSDIHQTSTVFYYDSHAPDINTAVSAMMNTCKTRF
ncbi:hypothetical protein IV493_06560 [Pantoea sp. SM3640]|uniref:hypothetical protein n=1 Tax=Pantoea sp. SM3640 TaxID=2787629 RepID=UPI0018A7396A|nr:hypothetical protein [Pantoea sp. SM3640]QPG28476.1 hypothetical protein IV493_06560 [Pantoea sp. SM3640]